MARAGSLLVDIAANTAKLQQDMNKANSIMSGFTKGVSRNFKILGTAIVGYLGFRAVSAGFRQVISFARESAEAAGEEELAQKKLATALGYTSEALLKQAAALQQQTTYADDAIVSAQALIAAFTKDEEATRKATIATLDLAAGAGMNLKDAANLVSKTLGSTTNALSRYGITVEGAVGSTARLESFVKNVTKVFGGQAQAEAETYSGKIKQVANAWSDFKEDVGRAITENRFVVESLRLVKETIEKMGKSVRDNKETFREFVKDAILFGVESLILFIKVADKFRAFISWIQEAGIRTAFAWEAIGKSEEQVKLLFGTLQEMIEENEKYAGSWKTVIGELDEFSAKLRALQTGTVKTPEVGPIDTGSKGVEADTKKIIEELSKQSISLDDYYGTNEEVADGVFQLWRDMTDAQAEQSAKRIEELGKEIVSLDDYYGTQEEVAEDIYQMWRKSSEERKESEAKSIEYLKDFVVNGFNQMADVVADFVTTGKANFKDFVTSAIADLTRLIVKMSILRGLEGIFKGTSIGSWLFPEKKQFGGPVYAGNPYIVGEAGPEVFVPKYSGSIVPISASSAPSMSTSVPNVTVQVINQTGQQVNAESMPPRFDGDRYILGVVLKGLENNTMGIRHALGGA